MSMNVNQNEIDSMKNILEKLNKNTDKVVKNIVTESKDEDDLAAIQTMKTTDGVSIANYEIVVQEKDFYGNSKRKFYSIVDNTTGSIVHDDIGLFESAFTIVKQLMFNTDELKKEKIIENIINNDSLYIGTLFEAHEYKRRMKTIKESNYKKDVLSAKFSNAKRKMQEKRQNILKLI